MSTTLGHEARGVAETAILTSAAAAALAFRNAGLLLPPVPVEFAGSFRQVGSMTFSTHDGNVADRDDWLARARDPTSAAAVAMSHDGHGMNSYALSYQLILPAVAIFVRQAFGGVYADQAEEARRFNAIVERLEEFVILTDAARQAARIPDGHRLIVAIDDRAGEGWELSPGDAFHDSEHPIEDALRSLTAAH